MSPFIICEFNIGSNYKNRNIAVINKFSLLKYIGKKLFSSFKQQNIRIQSQQIYNFNMEKRIVANFLGKSFFFII